MSRQVGADFISKIEGGLQELEESIYWLSLLEEAGILKETQLRLLREEAEELIAVFVTMVKNVKKRGKSTKGMKDEG